jgi:hypothetical protein
MTADSDMEQNWDLTPQKANVVFPLYGERPFVECPRCHYVGEAAGTPFDFFDLVALVPPVGHLLYIVLGGSKKKEAGLRCPMCDYDEVEWITEETARARLGNARFEHIREERHLRSARQVRTAVLVCLALAGAGYLILRFW